MAEQATFVPVRKRRVKAAKLPDALERAGKLIDWYENYKPEVRRVAVTLADYKAFEEGAGTNGVMLTTEGVKYRGFLIYVAP